MERSQITEFFTTSLYCRIQINIKLNWNLDSKVDGWDLDKWSGVNSQHWLVLGSWVVKLMSTSLFGPAVMLDQLLLQKSKFQGHQSHCQFGPVSVATPVSRGTACEVACWQKICYRILILELTKIYRIICLLAVVHHSAKNFKLSRGLVGQWTFLSLLAARIWTKWPWNKFFLFLFFGAARSISCFICTLSRCDGGKRTRKHSSVYLASSYWAKDVTHWATAVTDIGISNICAKLFCS